MYRPAPSPWLSSGCVSGTPHGRAVTDTLAFLLCVSTVQVAGFRPVVTQAAVIDAAVVYYRHIRETCGSSTALRGTLVTIHAVWEGREMTMMTRRKSSPSVSHDGTHTCSLQLRSAGALTARGRAVIKGGVPPVGVAEATGSHVCEHIPWRRNSTRLAFFVKSNRVPLAARLSVKSY